MKKYWNVFVFFIIIMIILGLWSYVDYKESVDNAIELRKTRTELQKELLEKTSCIYMRDSLTLANANLSKFKTLTTAMIHREEANKQLQYKIGDAVHIKRDSSRVIVDDILIGGGKYSYYIKYRVQYRDGTTLEVSPELIY